MSESLTIPYRSYTYLNSTGNARTVDIATEPVRVYGWNYHNENPSSAYVKLFNIVSADPTTDTPLIRLGIPPEEASGHVFAPGGILFDVALTASLQYDIADLTDDAPPDYSVSYEIFWLYESEV